MKGHIAFWQEVSCLVERKEEKKMDLPKQKIKTVPRCVLLLCFSVHSSVCRRNLYFIRWFSNQDIMR